jgi:hypothetical protein
VVRCDNLLLSIKTGARTAPDKLDEDPPCTRIVEGLCVAEADGAAVAAVGLWTYGVLGMRADSASEADVKRVGRAGPDRVLRCGISVLAVLLVPAVGNTGCRARDILAADPE